MCLGEVALPEDGQECASLIGRHDLLLGKIKEAGQFAAENRVPGVNRQHVRRLEAAARFLREMRSLEPGLLTLTENPSVSTIWELCSGDNVTVPGPDLLISAPDQPRTRTFKSLSRRHVR